MLMAVSGVHAEPSLGRSAQAETSAAPQASSRHAAIPANDNLARLEAALQLSAAQKATILPMLQKLQDELANVKQSGSRRGTDDARSFVEITMAQVHAQLTEAQQQVFDGMRPARRAEMFGN